MAKQHLNHDGILGRCSAKTPESCDFYGNKHFQTKAEGEAYLRSQAKKEGDELPTPQRKKDAVSTTYTNVENGQLQHEDKGDEPVSKRSSRKTTMVKLLGKEHEATVVGENWGVVKARPNRGYEALSLDSSLIMPISRRDERDNYKMTKRQASRVSKYMQRTYGQVNAKELSKSQLKEMSHRSTQIGELLYLEGARDVKVDSKDLDSAGSVKKGIQKMIDDIREEIDFRE